MGHDYLWDHQKTLRSSHPAPITKAPIADGTTGTIQQELRTSQLQGGDDFPRPGKPTKQGGPENPKAKRHRANHFFLHVGNSTVSSSLRRNLDVFPVAVDQSLHWSSCASVDRLIPSKHPLVDHFMHMANGAMPTSKATENDWCVSAI